MAQKREQGHDTLHLLAGRMSHESEGERSGDLHREADTVVGATEHQKS
jgi:hypothetical protein